MRPEIITASETFRFVKINPRKRIKLAVGLYALSTQGRELGRAVRSGYLFMRHIDDIVDGDRYIGHDPVSYVNGLRTEIATGKFRNGSSISTLARRSLDFLEDVKKPTDNPRQDFIDGIDAMLFDHRRLTIRRALTNEDLERHLELTISPGLNILLMGLGSSLRAPDISGFSLGLARVYSVRDFQTDWERGIINVPSEILEEGGVNPNSPFDAVAKSQAIQTYLESQLDLGKKQLHEVMDNPTLKSERLTSRIIMGFVKSADKILLTDN